MSGVALYLDIIPLVAAALTALRLIFSGLHRRYPVFLVFLLFLIFGWTVPLFLDIRSQAYEYVWVIVTPLQWIFYVLLVLELYRIILQKHQGLYTLGRWVLYGSICVSAMISALALLPRIRTAKPQASDVLPYLFAGERAVDFSLAILIVLLFLFLSRFPIPLNRNIITHAVLYTVYFLSTTAWVFVRTLFGLQLMDTMNLILAGMVAACMVFWLILLSPQGEEVPASFPHFGAEHEEEVLRQLESLNTALLKIAKN